MMERGFRTTFHTGVEWEVTLQSKESERTREMVFFVQARGFDVLATTLFPPKDKGNKALLLSGNVWFHKPGLSKPVPISQRQKLLGNAVYGDIVSTNYAKDYAATFIASEAVANEICNLYYLKCITGNTTYDQIRYWISQERIVGVKAEYLSLSGKIIKTATIEYGNFVIINGNKSPFVSTIRIIDSLLTQDITTLSFDKPRLLEIPNHIYNLNLLVK